MAFDHKRGPSDPLSGLLHNLWNIITIVNLYSLLRKIYATNYKEEDKGGLLK